MVCITGAEDGTVRLPPDGRANPPVSKIGDFTGGVDFQRRSDWIGPVRKMTGIGNNQDRSYVYESLPSLPYWNEPVMYETSGDFSIRLPNGKWRIAVEHGNEHVPVVKEFRTSGGTMEQAITLARWVDLPAEGCSGRRPRSSSDARSEASRVLLEYARAEDIHLVNVLEQYHHLGRNSRQLATIRFRAASKKPACKERAMAHLRAGGALSHSGHTIG